MDRQDFANRAIELQTAQARIVVVLASAFAAFALSQIQSSDSLDFLLCCLISVGLGVWSLIKSIACMNTAYSYYRNTLTNPNVERTGTIDDVGNHVNRAWSYLGFGALFLGGKLAWNSLMTVI